MTSIDAMIQTISEQVLPGEEIAIRQVPLADTLWTIPAKALRDVCERLLNTYNFYHLSTITGLDTGLGVEVLYHFWQKEGLTLRVVLPYSDLQIDTLTDLIPGAQFYEREVAEMLGVSITGLADQDAFVLTRRLGQPASVAQR